MHPSVHSSMIYNSRDVEATYTPLTYDWMQKMQCRYNRKLPTHKREKYNAIGSNMGGPRDYHTQRRESEREKPYDVICGI